MAQWTTEQVLALAPDTSSLSGGKELSSAAKWVSSGSNAAAAWGEAKGSGAKPYQTVIDLSEPAFKCSCPSRKFPCKHALGLFLRYAKDELTNGEPPEWATEWLDKRATKATASAEKAAKPEAPVDPAAAAKRTGKRWDNVLSGLDECEVFLLDVVSQGLLHSNSTRSWDEMAKRMIDCQAPGVARKLKVIGSQIGVGADWAARATAGIGEVGLLIHAGRRLDTFSEVLQADIRAAIGIPMKKEDLPEELAVADIWDVLGQVIEIEDRITVCRSWLKGRGSGRWAMHLAFSVAGQAYDVRLVPGSAFIAPANFYPSSWPLRAHIGERDVSKFLPAIGGTWEDGLERASSALAQCPWIEETPVHLSEATLGRDAKTWVAIDSQGQGLPVRGLGGGLYDLLARTGNAPSDLFGEWNGLSLRLCGAWGDWGYLAL